MSKFNDTYLKPALESLTGNAEFFVKKSHSTINRLNAESDSITKKQPLIYPINKILAQDINTR